MKKVGLPRTLVKIKYTLLTLSKGQGEAKKPASQVQAARERGEPLLCLRFKVFNAAPRARGRQLGSGAKILGDGDGI